MAKPIIVVSGLPRSGTSLMMQILKAGGIPLLVDNLRKPDENNPRGYFEFEKVKQLPQNSSWLKDACGKAVKIISELLPYLPPKYQYQIIFMERDLTEVLASQRKMLTRSGKPVSQNDRQLALLFTKHLKDIKKWLKRQPHIKTLFINYNQLLQNPLPPLKKLTKFLKIPKDPLKLTEAIDTSLYHHRHRSFSA